MNCVLWQAKDGDAVRRWVLRVTLSVVACIASDPLHAQRPADLPLFEPSESLLGPAVGASGTSAIEGHPGGQEGLVGGRAGSAAGRVPTRVAQPAWNRLVQPLEIGVPTTLKAAEGPANGSLALPDNTDDEGPANGLMLDQAIELLLRDNLDLRAKALELPQAEADVLTAGLRANPLMFMDSQLVPYGTYNPQTNPGGQTQYDLNMSLPIDVTRKRQARTVVAVQAKRVLDAQYQDAVRIAIDNLYTAYVDVLAARETVRFAMASVAGLDKLLEATRLQHQQTLKT
ncbi:MAG TPA: TolC family protein, partial [Pirellulales bacterium]|nr:TolC family protein [Pirellulales bacterium]